MRKGEGQRAEWEWYIEFIRFIKLIGLIKLIEFVGLKNPSDSTRTHLAP